MLDCASRPRRTKDWISDDRQIGVIGMFKGVIPLGDLTEQHLIDAYCLVPCFFERSTNSIQFHAL